MGAFAVLFLWKYDAGKKWYSSCKILVIVKFVTNMVTKLFSPRYTTFVEGVALNLHLQTC